MPTLLHARAPLLAALALVATLVCAHAPPASATGKSCAKAVIDDWYGNSRVDKRYPLHCYRAALRSLSLDQKDYMHADEDIRRALAYAKRGKNDPGVVASHGTRGNGSGDERPATITDPAAPSVEPGSPEGTVAADELADAGQSGIPLPLILLGGLALILLAAGGAGAVSRWLGRGTDTDED